MNMYRGWHVQVKAFLKNPDWKINTKAKDGSNKLYTRVSSNNFFCVKSVAFMNEGIEDAYDAICDLEMKKQYDESYEGGRVVSFLPIDASLCHYKFKKVLVVSARDMVVIGKCYRTSEKELYMFGKSCVVPSIPEVKGYVRADCIESGWRIKQIDDGVPGVRKPRCKIWFFSESDFKVSLFLQKQAGPKTGNMAKHLCDHVAKNPVKPL